MGYDLNRFDGPVDEELICPICSFILEDPVQVGSGVSFKVCSCVKDWVLMVFEVCFKAPDCEHAFCEDCINQWLKRQHTCPVDRTPIQPRDLKPVPRILKNLLSKLQLKCDHAAYGCTTIVKLEHLHTRVQECEFNPKKTSVCTAGCNMVLSKDELKVRAAPRFSIALNHLDRGSKRSFHSDTQLYQGTEEDHHRPANQNQRTIKRTCEAKERSGVVHQRTAAPERIRFAMFPQQSFLQ